MKRLEALNPQRITKNKRSLDSPSHPPAKNHETLTAQVPTSQKDNPLKHFSRSHVEMRRVPSESAYSKAAPSQRRQTIEPYHSSRIRHSGSPSHYIHRSVPLYPIKSHITKPTDPYKPSMSYGSNQPTDFTHGTWKAANPISSARTEPRPPPLLHQPPTVFATPTLPPSAYTSNTSP